MTEKVIMAAEDTETCINYSQAQIGNWAEVYTTDKTIMRRYDKFAKNFPDYCRLIKEDKYSMTFSVHPKCVSLYPKAPRKGKPMSEEQKKLAAERFAAYRTKAAE